MTFILAMVLLSSGVYDYTPITRNLDPGYVPDTREEYLSARPPFVPLEVTPVSGEARGSQFLVVLTESVADSLAPGLLDQWMADIQAEGITVSAVEITWSTPEEIRAWLSGLHSEGLEGVVLVGDVPSAWAALEDYADARSDETFPTD